MYQQRQTSRTKLFLEQEQPLLAALPAQAFTMITYKQATVQKNYHVFIDEDKRYYSVLTNISVKKLNSGITRHFLKFILLASE